MIALSQCSARQRREAFRMLARLHRQSHECDDWTPAIYLRHAHAHRVAHRLVRAGLAVAACSKSRPWYRHHVYEIALFLTRADALKFYPPSAIMRERP